MSIDYKFSCPQCKQHLEAPEDMLGLIVNCPACNTQIKIPNVHSRKFLTFKKSASSTCKSTPTPAHSEEPQNGGCKSTKKEDPSGCGQAIASVIFATIVFGPMRGYFNKPDAAQSPDTATPMVTQTLTPITPSPENMVYSTSKGHGVIYIDPMNGYFEFQQPERYKITVRKDKSTFHISEGSHSGTTVANSYIMLESGSAQIIIIARRTYQSFDEAVQSLKRGLWKKISIERERLVTIDGEQALEVIGSAGGTKVFGIKYKKHGLDHSLMLTCPRDSFQTCSKDFIDILRTYKSRSTFDNH